MARLLLPVQATIDLYFDYMSRLPAVNPYFGELFCICLPQKSQ
jgi:hypothetical protein